MSLKQNLSERCQQKKNEFDASEKPIIQFGRMKSTSCIKCNSIYYSLQNVSLNIEQKLQTFLLEIRFNVLLYRSNCSNIPHIVKSHNFLQIFRIFTVQFESQESLSFLFCLFCLFGSFVRSPNASYGSDDNKSHINSNRPIILSFEQTWL